MIFEAIIVKVDFSQSDLSADLFVSKQKTVGCGHAFADKLTGHAQDASLLELGEEGHWDNPVSVTLLEENLHGFVPGSSLLGVLKELLLKRLLAKECLGNDRILVHCSVLNFSIVLYLMLSLQV